MVHGMLPAALYQLHCWGMCDWDGWPCVPHTRVGQEVIVCCPSLHWEELNVTFWQLKGPSACLSAWLATNCALEAIGSSVMCQHHHAKLFLLCLCTRCRQAQAPVAPSSTHYSTPWSGSHKAGDVMQQVREGSCPPGKNVPAMSMTCFPMISSDSMTRPPRQRVQS